MTWLLFRSEAEYRAAVDLAAAFPIPLDDARAIKRQARGELEDGATAEGFTVTLSAALDAIRAARKVRQGARPVKRSPGFGSFVSHTRRVNRGGEA